MNVLTVFLDSHTISPHHLLYSTKFLRHSEAIQDMSYHSASPQHPSVLTTSHFMIRRLSVSSWRSQDYAQLLQQFINIQCSFCGLSQALRSQRTVKCHRKECNVYRNTLPSNPSSFLHSIFLVHFICSFLQSESLYQAVHFLWSCDGAHIDSRHYPHFFKHCSDHTSWFKQSNLCLNQCQSRVNQCCPCHLSSITNGTTQSL